MCKLKHIKWFMSLTNWCCQGGTQRKKQGYAEAYIVLKNKPYRGLAPLARKTTIYSHQTIQNIAWVHLGTNNPQGHQGCGSRNIITLTQVTHRVSHTYYCMSHLSQLYISSLKNIRIYFFVSFSKIIVQ